MNTAERIKKISECVRINSYLEIGVEKGITFNSLDFKYKTGVDPNFLFDFESFQNEFTQLHQITSNEFFSFANPKEKYDLIFLDGLHTYDQTLRDLNNALRFSHDSTIIIVDDVYPSDIFSSLRRNAQEERLAYDVNATSQAWHGDVFKTMFIVHDYYQNLSYKTIDFGYGNPQSLIIQQQRRNFKPHFNRIEDIERLNYFDFKEKIDLLNACSEGEALEFVISFLKKND